MALVARCKQSQSLRDLIVAEIQFICIIFSYNLLICRSMIVSKKNLLRMTKSLEGCI